MPPTFESDTGGRLSFLNPRHVRIEGLSPGPIYRISIEAGRGNFDFNRLFFTLAPTAWRPKPYEIGPVNTDFGHDNAYLPPRIDIHINGIFFYSMWFDAPALCELLNDDTLIRDFEKIRDKSRFPYDDGFGKRPFRFRAEGGVLIPEGGNTLDLIFPETDKGYPELLSLRVTRDQRYERAQAVRMDPVRSPHPRLYLKGKWGAALAAEMRAKNPVAWERLARLLDQKLHDRPEGMPNRNEDGREHWTREDRIGCYSFGYVLTENPEYLAVARQGVEELLNREHWGRDCFMEKGVPGASYSHYGCDTDMCQGVTPILAVILFYDWCHRVLEPQFRERIERKLIHHGEILFRYSMVELAECPSHWTSDHNTGGFFPLQMLGLLLADKYEQARFWLNWCRVFFEDSAQRCALDMSGASPYNAHTRLPLAGYIQAIRDLYGEDLASCFSPDLLVHHTLIEGLPELANIKIGLGSALHLALATMNKNPYAQWLGNRLSGRSISGLYKAQGFRIVREILQRDPAIPEASPETLPRVLHNPDFAGFWYRETWDSLASNPAAKPVLIRIENRLPSLLMDRGNPSRRYHCGNCFQGTFSIARGKTVFVPAIIDSYVNLTRNANALTVDDRGQFGEGAWLMPRRVNDAKATSLEDVRQETRKENGKTLIEYHLTQNLAPAYDADLKLTYLRRMIIAEESLPGNRGCFRWMRLIDEVTSAQPRRYRFFCQTFLPVVSIAPEAYRLEGPDAALEVRWTANVPLEVKHGIAEIARTYMQPAPDELAVTYLYAGNAQPARSMRLEWTFQYIDSVTGNPVTESGKI